MSDQVMRLCHTCRYWRTDLADFGGFQGRAPREIDAAGWGSCLCARFEKGYYEGWKELEFLGLDQVVIESDEGWGFVTGPDFGCVHWKAKTR